MYPTSDMMDYESYASKLAAVLVVYYGIVFVYRLFLHPLARFPGPKLAAISRWYEGYYDVILSGQYTKKISALHKQYGPIVRISPHELHIIDPEFLDKIYRLDGRWDKYSWTYDAFDERDSTLFGSEHDVHKIHRQAIAPYFSKAKVTARLDVIVRNVDTLSRRIAQLEGTTFNLGAAISALTRDVANEFVTGKKYHHLDLDDFGIALSITSQGGGPLWRITKHVRWFAPMMKSLPVGLIVKVADDGMGALFSFLETCRQDAREILTKAAVSPDSEAHTTLVHQIVHSKLPAKDKTLEHVFQETATVTAAAYETTASVLRLVLFHVFTNDIILQSLRDEIASAADAASGEPPLRSRALEQLPYLTAVLMEGLRLSPALASRTARITDKDLFYEDWRIPAGTPVGMTAILLHTDEKLYPHPLRFDPGRWLDPETRRDREKTFIPFSRGTRICLGMHLAWAELYLVIATLVQNFDFTIKNAVASDFELERDNFVIGTKAGVNLLAQGTVRT